MTRRERKEIERRLLVKSRLQKFYRSYKYILEDAIKYADIEVKGRLYVIENLFSPYTSDKNREEKKKKFVMPISYLRYIEFKDMKNWIGYNKNQEIRKAVKELNCIYQRQWFRNMEIFKMLIFKTKEYTKALKRNVCLKRMCQLKSYAGYQSRIFRKRRIEEGQILLKEFQKMHKLSKKEAFVNDVEEYIKQYIDFLVQCQFRLEKFYESIHQRTLEEKQLPNKKMILKEVEEEISLDLPGWSGISQFE